jgi:hypothetical protein
VDDKIEPRLDFCLERERRSIKSPPSDWRLGGGVKLSVFVLDRLDDTLGVKKVIGAYWAVDHQLLGRGRRKLNINPSLSAQLLETSRIKVIAKSHVFKGVSI